ncbi:MAG TPA: hypothetical protein VLF66_08515 [Thermoanaerobaculia bacterium]|nr:hypothetical protein [Thermoanaerobaculia bacterium]
MSDASDSRRPPTDVEALTEVLADRAREGAGPEPEVGELLDYLEGRLSPEAEAEIQRRLMASPEVSRKLLDLADLAEAGEAAEGRAGEEGRGVPADLAVHAAWRDLQGRLPGGRGASGGHGPGNRTRPPGRAGRPQPWLAALAAALFVAVLGLGFQLRRLGDGGGLPEGVVLANVETLELFETVRSDRPPTAALGPGEPLHLVLAPADRCPSYRAELAGPTEATVEGLERDERGTVSLLVPLRPGRYTLRLLGCEPERELSTYGFEIQLAGAATPGVNAS